MTVIRSPISPVLFSPLREPTALYKGGGGADALIALGAIGVWYANEAVTTGNIKTVPNKVAGASASPNLVQAPRRLFNNTGIYGKSGVTVTDNSTGNTGSTLVGTGNFSLLTTAVPVYPAGTYTMVVDCERVGESDQQFAMGWGTTNLATKTATATRQRLVHTATLSAGSHATYYFKSFDGSTGASIKVYEVAIYPGSADLEPAGATLVGDLRLGVYPFDSRPTVSSGIIDISPANAGGLFQWDTALSLSNVTAIWLTERVASTLYDTVFGTIGATTNTFGPKDFSSLSGQNPLNPLFSGRSLSHSPQAARAWVQPRSLNRGWEVMAAACSSTGATKLFHNKVKIVSGQASAAISTQTIAQMWFGFNSAANIPSGIRVVGMALFDKVLTDEEIRSAVDAIQANGGQTAAEREWYLIHEGDSLSAVDLFPAKAAIDTTTPTVFANYAVGASTFTNHNGRRSAVEAVPVGLRTGEKAVFTIYAATNELGQVGVSAADFINTYKTYLANIRAAGYHKIGVGTLLPSTISGYEAKRQDVLTDMADWISEGVCDFIFDFAADATIGPEAAASDPTYYSDGIHLTTAGQAIAKSIYQTAIEAALV